MLRIHFTVADLAATRVASAPEPLWEAVLGLQLLQNRNGAAVFARWRRHAAGQLTPHDRMLLTLAADAAYFPDFLTPELAGAPAELGLETIEATSRARLRAELTKLSEVRTLPSWTRLLADGDGETVSALGTALRAFLAKNLDPFRSTLEAHFSADRAHRLRAFAEGGCAALLSSFRPMMRWHPPVLETEYPVHRELHLGGRGLTLIPAFFCWERPVALADPRLKPVLVYPVDHTHALPADAPAALGPLLGKTRADVLRSVHEGCTTSELARRARTSVTSASQHAAVLRKAGLVTTRRHGGSVLHSLTPLGSALALGGASTPSPFRDARCWSADKLPAWPAYERDFGR
ncbi:winged helix-turn-helix domain-containing protein [Amycolatopsis sp. NPDC021455]|uniref:winged helix-turn-helix domain-containing protein n=1 Tax=Amycolatopsis sp. NPDC021455 TaxID=3154901 RepID=UPI0033EE91E9